MHGRGSSQGERTYRKCDSAFQETMRESWYPGRVAETRALRKAECATEEEGAGGEKAISTSGGAQWLLV